MQDTAMVVDLLPPLIYSIYLYCHGLRVATKAMAVSLSGSISVIKAFQQLKAGNSYCLINDETTPCRRCWLSYPGNFLRASDSANYRYCARYKLMIKHGILDRIDPHQLILDFITGQPLYACVKTPIPDKYSLSTRMDPRLSYIL